MKHLTLPALAAFAAATALAGPPISTPPVPIESAVESGWWFRIAPYGWVTAIDGDLRVGPLSAPLDVSMEDTLEDMDMAAMGILEAGYGRFSMGVDITYGKVSQEFDGGGLLFRSFRLEQKQWIINPTVAYRVIETDGYHMDIFAGARINVIEAELTGRFARGGEVAGSADVDWIDPIVGLRGQAELGDRFFFRYNGDIGGFGVSSDLTWQVFAGFGYHFNHWLSIGLGYRAIGTDYSDGDFELDTITHGPVIGLEARF